MTRQPWSAWTALSYPVAAAGPVSVSLHAWPVALWMVLLGVGTWAMHVRRTDATARMDHAGMMAALGALVVLGSGPWPALLAGAVGAGLAWWSDLYNHDVTAYLAVLAVLGASGASVPHAAGGLTLLVAGAAMIRVLEETDGTHAVWHVLTAAGMALLAVGVL